MLRTRGWVACLAVLGTARCGPAPAESFPGYGTVQAGPDCGPAGGAAVSLVFRPAPDSLDAMGPQLRLRIWRAPAEIVRSTFTSTDDPLAGSGYECSSPGTCPDLTGWTLRFGRFGADSSLDGELQVTEPNGRNRQGRFRATWLPRTVFCI